jgi:hypothetical protein
MVQSYLYHFAPKKWISAAMVGHVETFDRESDRCGFDDVI